MCSGGQGLEQRWEPGHALLGLDPTGAQRPDPVPRLLGVATKPWEGYQQKKIKAKLAGITDQFLMKLFDA